MNNIISHLSYSSMMCFLRNPIEFQKKYIAKVYDELQSPAGIVGKAFHKYTEIYLSSKDSSKAMAAAIEEIELVQDFEINFGKTGSREKMNQELTNLVGFWMKEHAYDGAILALEEKVEDKIAGVNFIGYVDQISRDANGKLYVVDRKSVRAYSPEDENNYKYSIQGYIYKKLVEAKYGEPVDRVIFEEIKISKNKDGSRQIRNYVLSGDDLLGIGGTVERLIVESWNYVNNPNSKFFPNPSDMLSGNDSMLIYDQMYEAERGRAVFRTHKIVQAPRTAPTDIVVDIMNSEGTQAEKILKKLIEFGIGGVIDEEIEGSAVTTFKLIPNRGQKLSRIASFDDDLSMALGTDAVRIIAPIYGTNTVGIEVPNEKRTFPVMPKVAGSKIPIGKDTNGNDVFDEIGAMPHMLVGGQTGSGKSVFLRNIIMNLKGCAVTIADCKAMDFEDLEPKYCSIVTDKAGIVGEIERLVRLMETRYAKKIRNGKRHVLVIDEYADLVMQLGKEKRERVAGYYKKTGEPKMETYTVDTRVEMEKNLARILQKGRAANISVIIATQRPDATIVAPIIKANCPVKACLRVSTAKNSEIILDEVGGERLLGKGDMLYLGSGMIKPIRVQCYAPIKKIKE
ncbi:MAG: DNA translocase FtsK [Candidatus Saccharimonadales bacterium]